MGEWAEALATPDPAEASGGRWGAGLARLTTVHVHRFRIAEIKLATLSTKNTVKWNRTAGTALVKA